MKRTVIGATVAVVLASVLGGGFVLRNGNAGIVRGVHAGDKKGCSLATLQGECLFTARDDAPAYAHQDGFPVVVAGVLTFDGAGNQSAVATLSLGGQITRIRAEGTYTLGADCNGTLASGGVRHFDIFVSEDGSEGVVIRTDDGTVATQAFHKR